MAIPELSCVVVCVDPCKGAILCEGNSHLQAVYNGTHAYADRHHLKVVVGSLGVRSPGSKHVTYLYGAPQRTQVHEFKHGVEKDGTVRWDLHVWLEDGAGRVWDVVSYELIAMAMKMGRRLEMQPKHVIEGVDRRLLDRVHTLVYVPAPANVQAYIVGVLGRLQPEVQTMFVHEADAVVRRARRLAGYDDKGNDLHRFVDVLNNNYNHDYKENKDEQNKPSAAAA